MTDYNVLSAKYVIKQNKRHYKCALECITLHSQALEAIHSEVVSLCVLHTVCHLSLLLCLQESPPLRYIKKRKNTAVLTDLCLLYDLAVASLLQQEEEFFNVTDKCMCSQQYTVI